MGPGITLVVLGAIFTFAVRAEATVVDLQTMGLIFMLAGAVIIAHYRREKRTAQVVTRVEHSDDGTEEPQTVHETITREVVIEDDGTSVDQIPAHGYDLGRNGRPGHTSPHA